MATISRAEYESQQAQLTELKLQNQWLLEQLGLAKKRQFGTSSERLQEGLMGRSLSMDLTPEERYSKRLELEKPVLDALLAWANESSAKTVPKSAQGKALHYLREQWPYLVRYLENGRLEMSNNRAERSIKPFVMG